ncbi:co-chaperone YbbN [Vibrio breoganii]|uniref:Co-chaperone YbbN n=1 Tax=Vibrio breoganii TaxID=553239 RepID=A0AAP8SXQ8_9VIBR|nr:co-chaperone YbbN [Vibrio breoganii]MDN3716284.1 co-chaperone YbbN [Vibrio breoganii]NMO72307.1 co-chaperone YbbN [Vibrio breoganii]NMR69798.1 co-chaperone YbbN [Vibrio breoganii]OCH75616.1 co-chaperone YbbN [Vibrio breoganii]OED98017.1 co-chaperone YbbN [Vibrio breoganii ZF-29]
MHSEFIVEMNQQNFQQILEGSMNTPVVVYFWAPMSQESADLVPQIQQLAQQYAGAFTLALLNCEQEQQIAGQFGIQALPTIALFSQGQAIDGLGGPQPIQAIEAMLQKHLPSQDELNLQKALSLMSEQQYTEALVLFGSLPEELQNKGEVKLAKADCLIATAQFSEAEAVLSHIPLEYQDNYYKGLMAKLELHAQAANSPEIQALETQLTNDAENAKIANELALQYHEVNRSDEALELLWTFISKDLGALDGEMRKTFMDVLSALGQENATAKQYRRQLYSILY